MTGRKKRGQGKSKDGKDDEEKADDDKADDDKADDDDAEKVGFCCTSQTNSNVCLNVLHVILLLLRATAAAVTKHVLLK